MLMRISFALVPLQVKGGPLKYILPDGYPIHGVAFLPRRKEETDLVGPEGLSFRTSDYSRLCEVSSGWFGRVIGGYPSGNYFNVLRERDFDPERALKALTRSETRDGLFFRVLLNEARAASSRRYAGRKVGFDESGTKNVALIIQCPKEE